MQVNEEVGKLAQSTPVLMSKSLELFMQLLLNESLTFARDSSDAVIIRPQHMYFYTN